jgi:purine-nucleoside phosphorylase
VSVSERIDAAAAFIRTRAALRPSIAVILGSGLGALAGQVAADAAIAYGDIPGFPRPTVEGHAGRLILGRLEEKPVVVMQGRVHFYEGGTIQDVVFPLRVMRALGAHVLLVTNASGGINRFFRRGDLMIIADHIHFMGSNPLMGPNEPALGPRFPDMSVAYDPEFIEVAERSALAEGIAVRKGVYIGVQGPSYETPAELRMFARWGADAVGMSTTTEVIAARHMGMRVLGLTAITDMATGEQALSVTHEEVIATAKEIEPKFIRLLRRIVRDLPPSPMLAEGGA